MLHSNRPPKFQRMNIAAGGTIHTALTERRILRATLRGHTFVIAHAGDTDRALDLAAEIALTGPAYTVLLTEQHLAGIQAGIPRQDVDVYVARLDHRVTGQIKVNAETEITLPTEHGPVTVSAATTRDLHTGDMFTCGDFTEDGTGRTHDLTVYRALADFNTHTGTVERHIVTRYWDNASPADRANLTKTLTFGPDHVVHRVTNRTALLHDLGLRDLAPTAH